MLNFDEKLEIYGEPPEILLIKLKFRLYENSLTIVVITCLFFFIVLPSFSGQPFGRKLTKKPQRRAID